MANPKSKKKQTKTKSKAKTAWFELTGELDEFKKIVHILNRYYNLNPSPSHPTQAHSFREAIVKAELSNLRVFLKKFGSYEFLVVVEIHSGESKRMDSWIHVDGISQERVLMKENGNLEHPVFKITSLTDLFLSHTKEVEKGFRPKSEDIAV